VQTEQRGSPGRDIQQALQPQGKRLTASSLPVASQCCLLHVVCLVVAYVFVVVAFVQHGRKGDGLAHRSVSHTHSVLYIHIYLSYMGGCIRGCVLDGWMAGPPSLCVPDGWMDGWAEPHFSPHNTYWCVCVYGPTHVERNEEHSLSLCLRVLTVP